MGRYWAACMMHAAHAGASVRVSRDGPQAAASAGLRTKKEKKRNGRKEETERIDTVLIFHEQASTSGSGSSPLQLLGGPGRQGTVGMGQRRFAVAVEGGDGGGDEVNALPFASPHGSARGGCRPATAGGDGRHG